MTDSFQPTAQDTQRRLNEVETRTGQWTAINIEVAPGVFTKGTKLGGDEGRIRALVQLVGDLTDRPFESLRVLDLGALEGGFGLEFALHGAEVILLEGRENNAEKIQFAIDALDVQRASVRTEDVRGLRRATHGQFDIVLCLGLLYHIDRAGLFGLLQRMKEVCKGLLIVDTQISFEDAELRQYRRGEFAADPAGLSPMYEFEVDGRTYRGRDYREHPSPSSSAGRLANVWASLDNEDSLWLTRRSLINALAATGFTTVLEAVSPALNWAPDRHVVIAAGGEPVKMMSTSLPLDIDEPVPEWEPHPDPVLEWGDVGSAAEAPPAPDGGADEIGQLRAELAQARSWLDSIQRSPSWRLTAPLRAIKRAVTARRA